jgi:hypothetical protein
VSEQPFRPPTHDERSWFFGGPGDRSDPDVVFPRNEVQATPDTNAFVVDLVERRADDQTLRRTPSAFRLDRGDRIQTSAHIAHHG